MSIDTIKSCVNKHNNSVVTTFLLYGRTFSVEVKGDVPEPHLQGYIQSHLTNLVWRELVEKPVEELSFMIASDNVKMRGDVFNHVGDE